MPAEQVKEYDSLESLGKEVIKLNPDLKDPPSLVGAKVMRLNPGRYKIKRPGGTGTGSDQNEGAFARFMHGAGAPASLSEIGPALKGMIQPQESPTSPGFGQKTPIVGPLFRQQRETFDQPGAASKVYGSLPLIGPPLYRSGKALEKGDLPTGAGNFANALLQMLGMKGMASEFGGAVAGVPKEVPPTPSMLAESAAKFARNKARVAETQVGIRVPSPDVLESVYNIWKKAGYKGDSTAGQVVDALLGPRKTGVALADTTVVLLRAVGQKMRPLTPELRQQFWTLVANKLKADPTGTNPVVWDEKTRALLSPTGQITSTTLSEAALQPVAGAGAVEELPTTPVGKAGTSTTTPVKPATAKPVVANITASTLEDAARRQPGVSPGAGTGKPQTSTAGMTRTLEEPVVAAKPVAKPKPKTEAPKATEAKPTAKPKTSQEVLKQTTEDSVKRLTAAKRAAIAEMDKKIENIQNKIKELETKTPDVPVKTKSTKTKPTKSQPSKD